MDEKIILKATVSQVDDVSLEAIAKKRDIVLPSEHIALFVASLAPLEEANQNGVRLSAEASRKFLTTINQAQVNFEHFGAGFICGAVIDSWIDEATKETKIAFTFYKMIYADDYIRALGLMAENDLSVSFELIADSSSKEILDDGTVRLNDFIYTGIGFLLDNPPAYKNADVFEFAKKVKDNITGNNKELVYANKIIETCDKILSNDHLTDVDEEQPMIFLITTSDDKHFHVAEINRDGNGQTISGHGEGAHPQPHMIVNWQIQVTDNADPETGDHAHRILNEIMASIKKYISRRHLDKDKDKKSRHIKINDLPDSAFAVIEPAFLRGETKNKTARHLPHHDGAGDLGKSKSNANIDLGRFRNALARLNQIKPTTDSISRNELIDRARKHLERHRDVLQTEQDKALYEVAIESIDKLLEQKGGINSMNEEEIKKVAELRAELGDFAKDVSDEDLLNDDKVKELKQAKTDSEKEADKADEEEKEAEGEEKKDDAESEEKKDDAEAEGKDKEKEDKDAKIAKLEKENKELKATNEARDSEIEKVRENAEKIGKLKVELADNPHVKDFSDEDYLDETKVKQAKLQKENDDLKAKIKTLQESKKSKETDKADEEEKEEVNASEEKEDLETGEQSKDKSFNEIMKAHYQKNSKYAVEKK